jgi:hypothetical protein
LTLAKTLKVSIDELMGYKAFTGKEEIFQSRKVLRKMKLLDQLTEKDKKTVFGLIDALASKGNHPKKD